MNATPEELLLVDDDPMLLRAASRALDGANLGPVLTCDDPLRVRHLLETRTISVMVVDLSMPRMGGRELLAMARADFPDVQVMVMTGSTDLEVAIQCMQEGAIDYLIKPVPDSRLCTAIRRALAQRDLQRDLARVQQSFRQGRARAARQFPEFLTQNERLRNLLDYVDAVAPSPAPVLIEGEHGTGKSLLAAAVHRLSGRPGRFSTATLGGTPATQALDALFGGGKAALAHTDGTLVLDGVDTAAPEVQTLLVRLLDDGTWTAPGSDVIRRCRARVVATAITPLADAASAGTLRRDLHHRLRRHTVELPPLRERAGDTPLLVHHFLAQAAAQLEKPVPHEPLELYPLLGTWHFPGNLQELADVCHQAVARHGGRMLALRVFREHIARGLDNLRASLPLAPSPASAEDESPDHWLPYPLPRFKAAQHALLREAMRRAGGVQGTAASMLGMKRSTFNRHWLAYLAGQ